MWRFRGFFGLWGPEVWGFRAFRVEVLRLKPVGVWGKARGGLKLVVEFWHLGCVRSGFCQDVFVQIGVGVLAPVFGYFLPARAV